MSLSLIFLVIFMDSLGNSMVLPIIPDMLRPLVSSTNLARTYGYFLAVYPLLQIFFAPLLGNLSDRFGRRTILTTSLLGGAADYFFMAFAPTLPVLMVGRAIAGISGANWTVANACIADISSDKDRSKNFGIIGAAAGMGFIVGPTIGGLLSSYGISIPFIFSGIFNLFIGLFSFFMLPESLSKNNCRLVSWAALNPLVSLRKITTFPALRGLLISYGLIEFTELTHMSIWTLYTKYRYGWNQIQNAITMTGCAALFAISQGFLISKFVKTFGEVRVIVFGCLGESFCFFLLGYATHEALFYSAIVIHSIFRLSLPALQSLITKQVSPDNQGELQGVLVVIMSITAVINPVIMTTIFAKATQHTPQSIPTAMSKYMVGSPYFVGSLCLLLSALFAHISLKSSHRT